MVTVSILSLAFLLIDEIGGDEHVVHLTGKKSKHAAMS
jgi:hypothetical protein